MKRMAPPTLRSISQTANDQSDGPYNQSLSSSGLIQASKTRLRGASKTLVSAISRSEGIVTFNVPVFFMGDHWRPVVFATLRILRNYVEPEK